MVKKKILVLTDDMPWGHRSIARAIYGGLKKKERENNWQVRYAEVKVKSGPGVDLYKFIYRYSPKFNRFVCRLANKKLSQKLIEELSRLNLSGIRRVVNRYKPDLVISSYFTHSHTLVRWRKREGLAFNLWTVVYDPWTINAAALVKGVDLHLVYDEIGEKVARNFGIPGKKILKTGWWVRQEMYKKYDRVKIRKKLGFKDDRPVIFVGGGSLGTNSLTRLLPVLLLVKKPVGVIINTGTDKLAYKLVDRYIKLFSKFKRVKSLVQIKNMGWINNMAEVLTASDIVFGKAGPNFLFDVVAVGRPFVAITHIGGQEDGNIDLIREKGLGWVKEKNGEAARFLLDYLKKPEYYNEKYKKTIRVEAKKNEKSLEKVTKAILATD